MERRGEFIRRVRAKVRSPYDRPETPFSANVEPFDYTTPRARAIMDAMNAGRDSRHAKTKIDLRSQGVIWRGKLWFWCDQTGYQIGLWTPGKGRPALHRVLWEEEHGRPVPGGGVVRCADGNPNNLDPANLVLATRNEIARENQAAGLFRKSRAQMSALLERGERRKDHTRKHENPDTLLELRSR